LLHVIVFKASAKAAARDSWIAGFTGCFHPRPVIVSTIYVYKNTHFCMDMWAGLPVGGGDSPPGGQGREGGRMPSQVVGYLVLYIIYVNCTVSAETDSPR